MSVDYTVCVFVFLLLASKWRGKTHRFAPTTVNSNSAASIYCRTMFKKLNNGPKKNIRKSLSSIRDDVIKAFSFQECNFSSLTLTFTAVTIYSDMLMPIHWAFSNVRDVFGHIASTLRGILDYWRRLFQQFHRNPTILHIFHSWLRFQLQQNLGIPIKWFRCILTLSPISFHYLRLVVATRSHKM
jgi:hypothetical protein